VDTAFPGRERHVPDPGSAARARLRFLARTGAGLTVFPWPHALELEVEPGLRRGTAPGLGGHHVDIAHWGLGLDRTGPVEIGGSGEFPKEGPFNSPVKYRLNSRYRDGLSMVIAGGHGDIRFGTKWVGDLGGYG